MPRIYIDLQNSRTHWVITAWVVAMTFLMFYLPWEDSSSVTHHRFLWDARGHLDLGGLIFNVVLVTIPFACFELVFQVCAPDSPRSKALLLLWLLGAEYTAAVLLWSQYEGCPNLLLLSVVLVVIELFARFVNWLFLSD